MPLSLLRGACALRLLLPRRVDCAHDAPRAVAHSRCDPCELRPSAVKLRALRRFDDGESLATRPVVRQALRNAFRPMRSVAQVRSDQFLFCCGARLLRFAPQRRH